MYIKQHWWGSHQEFLPRFNYCNLKYTLSFVFIVIILTISRMIHQKFAKYSCQYRDWTLFWHFQSLVYILSDCLYNDYNKCFTNISLRIVMLYCYYTCVYDVWYGADLVTLTSLFTIKMTSINYFPWINHNKPITL